MRGVSLKVSYFGSRCSWCAAGREFTRKKGSVARASELVQLRSNRDPGDFCE